MSKFRDEVEYLINRYSIEGRSDTPDFLLADYLDACLKAFEVATRRRDQWHGFAPFGEEKPVAKED